MFNYSESLNELIMKNFLASFSKYKLQYQLTSTIIAIFILMHCFESLLRKKGNFIFSILLILVVLGFSTAAFHASDITVRGIRSKSESYELGNHFMYAPFPDWDFKMSA